MSDQSGLVSIPNSLNLDEVRLKFLEGLGKSRLATVTKIAGAHTCSGIEDEVWADLTSGAYSVTLPASPVDGDRYEFAKIDASGNALTIARNGKTINGAASDVTVTTQWATKRLTWSASANTWLSR